jgi:ABC-type transporter Mla subunit MlaD
MNLIVLVAGETLGGVGDLIDPSKIVDSIIDQLPPEIAGPVKGLIGGAGGILDNPLGDLATDAVAGAAEAIGGVLGGGGEESSDLKAAKDIAKLITSSKRLLRDISQMNRLLARPFRNLRDAAHGRAGDESDYANDFESVIDSMRQTLETAEEVFTSLKSALEEVL